MTRRQETLDSQVIPVKPKGRRSIHLNGNGEKGGLYDPAFTGNRNEPVHRWVPWIAGYSSHFVEQVLTRYARRNGHAATVLDPFAGVGTTLFQARRMGYDSIGFEINPWAALVSRVKMAAGVQLTSKNMEDAVHAYRTFAGSHREPESTRPEGFRTREQFYSPSVERKALIALDFISSIDDPWTQDAFRVAFGAVMVSFSNYTYEPSLGSRKGADKALVHDADVPAVISAKAMQMADDIRGLEAQHPPLTKWAVHPSDFLEYGERDGRLADIAIMSPPYLNNYHYVRNTRPQLWWLSLVKSTADLKPLETRSVGKFWQTVRNLPPIRLDFEDSELSALLETLRSVRSEKGAYGGPGWANYAATYFNDSWRFLKVLHRTLSEGGVVVIVIGNSIVQGVNLRVDEILARMASQQGFDRVRLDILRESRVGASILNSSVRRGNPLGKAVRLYESAVILRKRVR